MSFKCSVWRICCRLCKVSQKILGNCQIGHAVSTKFCLCFNSIKLRPLICTHKLGSASRTIFKICSLGSIMACICFLYTFCNLPSSSIFSNKGVVMVRPCETAECIIGFIPLLLDGISPPTTDMNSRGTTNIAGKSSPNIDWNVFAKSLWTGNINPRITKYTIMDRYCKMIPDYFIIVFGWKKSTWNQLFIIVLNEAGAGIHLCSNYLGMWDVFCYMWASPCKIGNWLIEYGLTSKLYSINQSLQTEKVIKHHKYPTYFLWNVQFKWLSMGSTVAGWCFVFYVLIYKLAADNNTSGEICRQKVTMYKNNQ